MQREGFGKRFMAAMIDLVIMVVGAFIVAFAAALAFGQYGAAVVAGLFALGYSSLEIFKAATPGKMMLDLKITDESGNAASSQQLAKRWLFKQAPSALRWVAAITAIKLFDHAGMAAGICVFIGCLMTLKPSRQAWHDMFAKTAVCGPAQAGFQVIPIAPTVPTAEMPVKQAA